MIDVPIEIKSALKEAGFDRTQVQVVLFLLKDNMHPIQDIAKMVSLPRSSVQLACEELLVRGVLKVFILGKRRIFYIEHSRALKNYLSFEELKINSKKIVLEKTLPKISSLFPQQNKSENFDVEYFNGEDGFLKTFFKSLEQEKNGEILRFGGDPALFIIAREKLKEYRQQRVKKKIYARILLPKSSLSKDEAKDSLTKFRDIRFLSKKVYNPNVNISIWRDKVSITVWDTGLHSMIVTNSAYASFMKTVFEICWSQAKEF